MTTHLLSSFDIVVVVEAVAIVDLQLQKESLFYLDVRVHSVQFLKNIISSCIISIISHNYRDCDRRRRVGLQFRADKLISKHAWEELELCVHLLMNIIRYYNDDSFFIEGHLQFWPDRLAFHVPGFTDSGFSRSGFYRFRLFVFRVLQIPAFCVPGFLVPRSVPRSLFYR